MSTSPATESPQKALVPGSRKPLARGLAICLTIALAVLIHDFVGIAKWVGSFPLEVRLETNSDAPISEVWYDATPSTYSRERPDLIRQDLRHGDIFFKEADDFDGNTFIVTVRMTGATSHLGRELDYHQDELLVVKIDFENGHSSLEFAEIPDGREARQVTVRLDDGQAPN
ncbi:MAG: hypothetical protein DWQ34_27160 [Planctomycetota bacterium]|nr:MAG: hypothetical protein DWQ34_27160 [Planctomycetota bacterium]REK24162.1 MAG: hypothetical protein DWQ41_14040 [Planctomycetota bacterium]REK38402.1 MAG: hypothetical protein DWQ45_04680 [Planctomycetota bacterium]